MDALLPFDPAELFPPDAPLPFDPAEPVDPLAAAQAAAWSCASCEVQGVQDALSGNSYGVGVPSRCVYPQIAPPCPPNLLLPHVPGAKFGQLFHAPIGQHSALLQIQTCVCTQSAHRRPGSGHAGVDDTREERDDCAADDALTGHIGGSFSICSIVQGVQLVPSGYCSWKEPGPQVAVQTIDPPGVVRQFGRQPVLRQEAHPLPCCIQVTDDPCDVPLDEARLLWAEEFPVDDARLLCDALAVEDCACADDPAGALDAPWDA